MKRYFSEFKNIEKNFSSGILIYVIFISFLFPSLYEVNAIEEPSKISDSLESYLENLSDAEIVKFESPDSGLRVLIVRKVTGNHTYYKRGEEIILNVTEPVISQTEVIEKLNESIIPFKWVIYEPPSSGSAGAEVILGAVTKRQIYDLANMEWVSSIDFAPMPSIEKETPEPTITPSPSTTIVATNEPPTSTIGTLKKEEKGICGPTVTLVIALITGTFLLYLSTYLVKGG